MAVANVERDGKGAIMPDGSRKTGRPLTLAPVCTAQQSWS